MARALKAGWFDRFGAGRRRSVAMRPPIVASRDLPPRDPLTLLALPRAPDPLPDEALMFARNAAVRVRESTTLTTPISIAQGADLRAMLERIEQAGRRREALDQAAQARARIVEQLAAGKGSFNRPALQLVAGRPLPADAASGGGTPERDLDAAMAEALTSALGMLRQISALAKR